MGIPPRAFAARGGSHCRRTMGDIYADVIVNITHADLDRSFQYRVPERLAGIVREGTPVTIPFGRGTRTVEGYVVGLSDSPAVEPDKIREIIEVRESGVTAEGRLIELAAWMKRTYGSTMIRALKTILPVREKTKGADRRRLRLAVDPLQAKVLLHTYERKHSTAKKRLLEDLLRNGPADRTEVEKRAKVSSQTIRAMIQDGTIAEEAYTNYRMPSELKGKESGNCADTPLTEEQRRAYEAILAEWAGRDRPVLLQGVTGSGKTLVYMALIEKILGEGGQAILLIPEIALSWQTVRRFHRRFGDIVTVLHSKMSDGERYDQYERVRRGEARIAVGPRSALFLPFPKLGLIIVDEEQEDSYRSEIAPRYDAREAAIERGRLEGAHVLFGSATPSVDVSYRCETGEFARFYLRNRYGGAGLPAVSIVDMRRELAEGNRSIISGTLAEKMEDRLEKKEQTLLFLNRRGYAGFVSCRSCGCVIKCPHCDVSLTYHTGGRLICHYCGYEVPMVKKCPSCGSPYIGRFGTGTERVQAEVEKRFPGIRTLRMDADTVRKKDSYEKILRSFSYGEADVLIGTQMIIKGHDFPKVTLVGALAADLSLYASDYRAAEKTYQILVQAVGRAGRRSEEGEAVIQTYHPDHYSIVAAAGQDYDVFYQEEMNGREILGYPPVSNMLEIHASCEEEELLDRAMQYIRKFLQRIAGEHTVLLGPAPEAVAKVQDQYRRILYVRNPDRGQILKMRAYLEKYLEINEGFRKIAVQYDLNA